MDSVVTALLAEYEARSAAEWKLYGEISRAEAGRRIDEFLLCVGPETGGLLNLLVKAAGCRSILEIGTSYGYSTVWLAEAARHTGGKIVSLDIHRGKQEFAANALARAGLADQVEFRLGDALETIAALPGPFDFVLLDLWKDLYVPCFDLFAGKLAPGAFVVADNILQPESARPSTEAYRRHVRARPHFESVLLPIGTGIEISRYAPGE
jgi:predicted O-methyltransferase YrrM